MNILKKQNINPLSLLLVLGLYVFALSAYGQNASSSSLQQDGKKYAVLTSQPNHVKAAVLAAKTMSPQSNYSREAFEIMACAQSVKAFIKGSEFESIVQEGMRNGVRFKVCGLSLKQLEIAESSIMDGIEIVENGLVYMFDLQENGYTTVEL